MDTTITGIGAVVVAKLRSVGYMESTIYNYSKSIKALTCFATTCGTDEYSIEMGARFAELTTSPRTGRFSRQRMHDYRRLAALFDSYVTTSRVDLSMRTRGGGGPRPTSPQFTPPGRVVGNGHGRARSGRCHARGVRAGRPRLFVFPRITRHRLPR